MSAGEEIIQLDDGYGKVYREGIKKFIDMIEEQKGQFLKAQEFVLLYDIIFKMCIQRDPYNWSEKLYGKYSNAITNHLDETVIPSFQALEAGGATPNQFLQEWRNRWRNEKLIVDGLRRFFMYLDRFYTPNTENVKELKDQGYWIFKQKVFEEYKIKARTAILTCIERERDNEAQDRDLLQEAVNVFTEMGYNSGQKMKIYKGDLEKFVLEHASLFYKARAKNDAKYDLPNYLKMAEQSLLNEKTRVEQYLHRSTMDALQQAVYVELLRTPQGQLLTKETGVDAMLRENAREDLSRLYRLYKGYPEDLQPIADLMDQHIQRVGVGIVAEKDLQGHDLVTKLISLHAKFADIVAQCFEKSHIFQKALKKGFEAFINKDDRVSNLLASFVNDVLSKGSTISLAEGLEKTLDNVVFLYGYISEKDVFERQYQNFLSKRLLGGLCESFHSEKSMIAKLKNESGHQWCHKLEGMFKDITQSKELMNKFKQVYDAEAKSGIELSVNVCSSGYWPASANIPYTLPPALKVPCDKFQRFYLNQHNGHKLIWHMDKGQSENLVNFSPKISRTLVGTTYQMMILLCFNDTKILSFKQILDKTGVPKYEIAHHLLSLCHPKVQVLLKRPSGKTLEEDHKFMINGGYTNVLLKVSIPLMAKMKGEVEAHDDEEKIIELQRRHQIDAAIVRIMKIRKTMKHPQLTGEVISQLKSRFSPTPNVIKKRIEALIEQEYLERDKGDRSVYKYLA